MTTPDNIPTLPAVLVGGGGHALSLLECAPDEMDFSGYLARSASDSMPLPWLGNDAAAQELASANLFHIAVVYSRLPVMDMRRGIIESYRKFGARFATIISPRATVTRNSRIGEGCAVLTGAIVNRASLADHVIVNSGAIVEHDCCIGENTFIGPGAVIGGTVRIGRDCFIGLGARIKNCVTIADGVSVAMGAVVDRDLLEPGIYHGTPLRLHKPRNRKP